MIGAVSAASDTSTEDIVNQDISIENNQNNHNDHENDVKVMEKTKKTTENNKINTNTNTNNLKKTEETQNTNTNNTNHQTTNTNNKLKTNNNNENLLKETQTTAKNWTELKNKAEGSDVSIELNGDEYTATGTISISSGSKVTIEGNGKTINGQKQYQIFKVNGELILKNLNIINGKSDNDGGAIYNNGKLTIINCTFTNNTANDDGGAIYANDYSTVNINNNTFTQNNAKYHGGAIYANDYSTVNINNNTFTQNNATYHGGAIYANDRSTVNINNNTFTQNNARYGGAISNYGTVIIMGSELTDNTAEFGGAISNYGTVIIMGSELTDNTAKNGGAIYNQYGTLTLVDSNLQNDGLSIFSGYIDVVPIGGYIAFVTTRVFDISVLPAVDVDLVEIQLSNGGGYSGEVWVNVTNSTFNQIVKVNLKNGEGSGTINLPIGNKYNATINTIQGHIINPQTQEFTTIHETSFTALYNNITNSQDDTLTLTHDYIYDNRTDTNLKTGIPINKTITINGNGHTINGNKTARIFKITNNAQVTITNITLTQGQGQNDGPNGWNVGGAIYANNTKITIINSTLTQNNADDGGAISTYNSQLNITGNTITNNTANYNGGAIYNNGKLTIINCTFTQNTATEGSGEAIYADLGSTVNINNTNFTHNTATMSDGGAIYAEQYSTVNINNTQFKQNTAYSGGAIYANSYSTVNINNTKFTQNNADWYGGAIYNYGTVIIMGSELTDNTATYDSGAIFNYGTLTLVDSNLQNDGLSIFSGYLDVVHIGGDIAFVTTQVFDISVLPAVDVDLVEIQLSNGGGYTGEVWVNVTNSTFNQIVKVNLKNGKGSGTINLPIGNKYNATINTIQGHIINPQTQEFTTIHETSFTALYNNITNSQDDTLTLTHDYIYDNRTDTNLKTGIPINKTITINGNGHTINGNKTARIFKITNNAQVTINNITLTQGQGQNDGPYGDNVGGAIYANNAKITMANCTLTQNNAEAGGAIHTENSQLNITGNTITGNTAKYGGAIYTANSQLNITGNNITGNTATGEYSVGGAITTYESQLNITGNNITGNTAWNGGAITTSNSQLNITRNTITGNTAWNGGAIYTYDKDIVNIISNLFMDNTAKNNGRAIYGDDFNNLTVNGNIFLNNTGSQIIYLKKESYGVVFGYDLGCNWFGNNASNYKDLIKDDIVGISGATLKFDNWLFLTANSTPVTALSGGNVTFKLSLYNSSKSENNVSDFDNGLLYPVDLTVSYVNGTGDESVRLGGNVAFKPDTVGIGSVTANISNVGYTIGLTIDKEVYVTEITDLSFNDLFEGKPVTVNGTLKYNGTNVLANQKINVTISNNTYIISQYGYTDSKGKFSITLTPPINGNVNITATYQGNDTDTKITYNATNATTTTNIAKVTYNITFDKLEPSYDYNTTITITGKVTSNYSPLDVSNVNITLNNGDKTSINLINGQFTYTFQGTIGGLNNITVTCKDATNTTQTFIKYPTNFTITVSNSTTDKPITINVTEANKFTGDIIVSIAGANYTVILKDGEGINNINTLNKIGNYVATINYPGNLTYNATTAISNSFTIKYPTKFTIQNIPDFTEGSTIELIVNEKNNYTGQVNVTIGTETYTLDMFNGTGSLTVSPNLSPGTYTAKIKFNGNTNYTEANATSNNFTINAKPVPPSPTPTPAGKQNTKIVAKNKVYKLAKYRTYKVTVKNSKGKPVKNTRVKLKIGKKTYTSKTNKKGIATFKIPNKKSKKKTKKSKKTWKITATLNKNAKNDN